MSCLQPSGCWLISREPLLFGLWSLCSYDILDATAIEPAIFLIPVSVVAKQPLYLFPYTRKHLMTASRYCFSRLWVVMGSQISREPLA